MAQLEVVPDLSGNAHAPLHPTDGSTSPIPTPPSSKQPSNAPPPNAFRSRRLLVGALIFALIVMGSALLSRTRQVASLEREVSNLRGEVAEAQQVTSAYRARLGEVRVEVAELVSRIGGLFRLVSDEPVVGGERPEDRGAVANSPQVLELGSLP